MLWELPCGSRAADFHVELENPELVLEEIFCGLRAPFWYVSRHIYLAILRKESKHLQQQPVFMDKALTYK